MFTSVIRPIEGGSYIPYYALGYLGMIYMPYLFGAFSWGELLPTLLATVLFIPIYLSAIHRQGLSLWVHALAISALGVALSHWNPNATALFTFSVCLGAGFIRLRDGYFLLAINLALVVLAAWLFQPTLAFLAVGLFFPLVAGLPVLFMSAQGRSREQLFRKQEEIEHLAKIAERERIARDMHDVLGHTLSLVALKSELARKLIRRSPERAETEIAEVEQCARDGLKQVRDAISGYRSTGLVHEIQQAEKALSLGGVQLRYEAAPPELAPALENVLALVLREAVTNILRHARATVCHITFQNDAQGLHCQIRDNGVGANAAPGNGQQGMRERIEALHGTFDVKTTQAGMTISLRLPLHQAIAS